MTNNETELRAIEECVKLFTGRAYLVIESDSQGCLDSMTGRCNKWEADDWRNLSGNAVKDQV
jgi:ribonuclease HI